MRRTRLLVEWDETSAMGLAEAVWDAGGTVRVLEDGVDAGTALHPQPVPLTGVKGTGFPALHPHFLSPERKEGES